MDTRISVALATYNGEKYLTELLDSLASQSYLPYELVVSDDNSSDNTLTIIEEFAKTAPFKVNIIKNTTQLGVIKNFATAFENVTGTLIAYCDQDDVWHKEKLKKCVYYFSDPNIKLTMHRSEIVDAELHHHGFFIPQKKEVEIGKTPFPSSTDMTYGLGHQMLFDRKMFQDFYWIFNDNLSALDPIAANYDLLIRFLAGMNGDIIFIDDALVKFRRHESATSDAGLAYKNTEGFLGKKGSDYIEQGKNYSKVAATIKQHILPKMPEYNSTLKAYCSFLDNRSIIFNMRGTIYSSNSTIKRTKNYIKLFFKDTYKPKSRGGLGRKALLVDLFVSFFSLKGAQKIISLKP